MKNSGDISDYYVTEQPSATQLLRGIYYEDGITLTDINEANLSDIEYFILTLALYEDARTDKETILTLIGLKKRQYVNNPFNLTILTKLEERICKKRTMLEKDYYLEYITILEQLEQWKNLRVVSGGRKA